MKHTDKIFFIFLLAAIAGCAKDNQTLQTKKIAIETMTVDQLADISINNSENMFIEFRADWCVMNNLIKDQYFHTTKFKKYIELNRFNFVSIDVTGWDDNILAENWLKKNNIEHTLMLPLYVVIKNGEIKSYNVEFFSSNF
jgi:thiol:disulfide interchange protein